MKYFCHAFLLAFWYRSVNTCKNFLVQQCTDILIGFHPLSTIKCIQLFPAQFDLSFEYSVKNYIIKKTIQCHSIVSYDNSSSIILFSNECRELCPEEYCLLFDHQSNTSIINIFYSSSSIYQSIKPLTNNSRSYDYYYFDTCSSINQKDRIFIIVAAVLFAIVVILTIAVISKFIVTRRLRKGEKPYRPYDILWILDCLFCQIKSADERTDKPLENSIDMNSTEDDHRPRMNPSDTRNSGTTSTQPNMISTGSSNTRDSHPTNRNNRDSGNSSGQGFANFSSETNTSITPHQLRTEYIENQMI